MRFDDKDHARVEAEVVQFATDHGWLVGAATYHQAMPDPVVTALSRCWDPAALYIRGRADRCAVKEEHCVLFEVKTNPGKWTRAAIEALPLSYYIRLEIPCLYIWRDHGEDFAFWTTELPVIDVIFLPRRFSQLHRFFRKQFTKDFPDVEIVETPGTSGSDDPFVVIRRDAIQERGVDWKQVFTAEDV